MLKQSLRLKHAALKTKQESSNQVIEELLLEHVFAYEEKQNRLTALLIKFLVIKQLINIQKSNYYEDHF